MRIAVIGTAGIPARYGGFETLVENLIKKRKGNIQYTVFCSARLYQRRQNEYLGAELKYIKLKANGMSSMWYDLTCMFLSLRSDAMLILGVSGSLFLPIIRLLYRGKIITNIDGIEWKRNKWNKLAQFILHVSEKAAVRYSDIVIGDNQGIVEYVVKAYKKNAVLIEYGADHIKYFPNDVMKETLYAISVCRIEPENNIHLILEAFSCGTDLSLMVVGNWKNSEYGIRLLYKYKDITRFHLLDPIYDLEKINILRSNAFLYVHGHSAGGTNPSLVEAMFLGLPIFAFDCIYNRFTTEDQCVYWSNADELHSCIINQGNSNLNSIGKKMKLIAERKYCWNAIVSKYENLFLNVLRRNLPPG